MRELLGEQPRYREVIEHLGKVGSRALITTPALECDLDALEENIAAMASVARNGSVALRPHVKSHKSAYIAARQLEAGAVGLSFAKLSEAEAVIAHLPSVGYETRVSALITSPLVGSHLAERAWRLAEHCDLLIVADSLEGVDELARAARRGVELSVLCDVDLGMGRTGVAHEQDALRLAERVATGERLRFAGVQGYAGNLQHLVGKEHRREQLEIATTRLSKVIDALVDDGHDVALRTGGGTGSALIDIELGLLNELQCGSYIFMDREYREALGNDPEGGFAQSLTIATTVISANHDDHVTVDAGLKSMATDAGTPLVVGHEASAPYSFRGDEHGCVTAPRGLFARGERLHLVPPHCDPTVNLYDVMWLVRNDVVVDVALIYARGRSQ